MRTSRRLLPLLLGTLLVAGSVTPALAEDPPAPGTPPVGPDQGFGTRDAFVGPTSMTIDTCEPAIGPASVGLGDPGSKADVVAQGAMICPDHYLDVRTYYKVDRVMSRYDGFLRAWAGYGCIGPCTARATDTRTAANRWSASIGFEKGPIQGTVGYDVTWTEWRSFGFDFPVPSGKTGSIYVDDWYHTTKMAVYTLKTGGNYPAGGLRTNGTAWAGKFYMRYYGIKLS